jgi:hypothetical protein
MRRKHFYDNVELDHLFLKEIPDNIAMYACHGSYDISNNKLASLKNCSSFVKGNFDCSHNNLTSLRDGPQEVQGSYYCNFNKLTSLDGIAKIIGGGIDVSYNQLTSLQGLPRLKSNRSLKVSDNKITSLIGYGFESIEFSSFDVTVNKLTSLVGSPYRVSSNYECDANPIENFVGGPRYVGRSFYATNLPNLKSIEGLPETIENRLFISIIDMRRIFPGLTDGNILKEIRSISNIIGGISTI